MATRILALLAPANGFAFRFFAQTKPQMAMPMRSLRGGQLFNRKIEYPRIGIV